MSTDSRPPDDSAGSGSTACPATWKIASASAFAPVTVATCTTQGHGTGGSATGSLLLKRPSASVVTARPSGLAQELVPPVSPRDGTDCPQIRIISSARARHPSPVTVIEPPVPACDSESLTACLLYTARGGTSSASTIAHTGIRSLPLTSSLPSTRLPYTGVWAACP